MRTRSVLTTTTAAAAVIAAFGATAATASAAAPCAPPQGTFDSSYQARLSPLMEQAQAAAMAALGPQFTMLWLDPARQGWTIGVAPGPQSVEAARDAIVARLDAVFPPADASYLASVLLTTPEPYSKAQLDAARDAITRDLTAAHLGVGLSSGYGLCTLSDGVRIEVMLFNDSTPEIQDRVRALLAPYGDIVRLGISAGGPPTAVPGPSTTLAPPAAGGPPPGGEKGAPAPLPRAEAIPLSRYVTLPSARRCVRGSTVHVAVRAAARGQVRSVVVTVAGRKRVVGIKNLKKPLAVALRGRRTTLTVTAKLADGRAARRTIVLTRCG